MHSIELIKKIKDSMRDYCIGSCLDSCCNLYGKSLKLDYQMLSILFESELKGLHHLRDADKLTSLISRLSHEGKLEELHVSPLYDDNEYYILQELVCPRYDENSRLCGIYDQRRPIGCEEFPISLREPDEAILDTRCEYIVKDWERISSVLNPMGQVLLWVRQGDEVCLLKPSEYASVRASSSHF